MGKSKIVAVDILISGIDNTCLRADSQGTLYMAQVYNSRLSRARNLDSKHPDLDSNEGHQLLN